MVDERWYWQFELLSGNDSGVLLPFIDGQTPTGLAWSDVFSRKLRMPFRRSRLPRILFRSVYLNPNFFAISGASPCNIAQLLDLCRKLRGAADNSQIWQRLDKHKFYGWQLFIGELDDVTESAFGQPGRLAYDIGSLQSGNLATFPNQAALAPSAITVAFRYYTNGIVIHDWKRIRHMITVGAGSAGWSGVINPKFGQTILSTALADVSNVIVANQSNLQALANQIATDYYAGIWIQDSAVIGVSQWQESGYDDYVEFDLSGESPHTRIHSTPYNQTAPVQFSYDPSTWEYGERISGTLDGALSPKWQ